MGTPRSRRYRIAVNRATLFLLLLAGCGLAPGGRGELASAVSPGEGAWSYEVTVAGDLARIDVTLALRGSPPPRLILGDAAGLPFIASSVAAWGSSTKTLVRDAEGFSLDGIGDGATVTYRVDLAGMVDGGPGTRVGRSFCARPGLWLLRPQFPAAGASASLVFHLADGVNATVPWPARADGSLRLDETSFRWRGFAAFGRLERHTIDVDGAKLHVAILDRPHAATWPGLERWITAAARAQSSLYGELPVQHLQIVVKPVSSNQAVPFGETQRGGGRAVILLVGDEAKDADFERDWVAVHEFAHLGMPAIADEDAWLSEGFIQYYTEVLMGRAGILDERGAWDELVAGFARGAGGGTTRTLRDESATMALTHSYFRVYWGGAAIAFFLDVELRRASSGTKSLDDAIRETRRAFAARLYEATAAEIAAHLDAWHGRPLFTEISSRHLASTDFPATAETLARLGVIIENGLVTGFDDAAPDASIRRGIMGR